MCKYRGGGKNRIPVDGRGGDKMRTGHFWFTTGSYDRVLVSIAMQIYGDGLGTVVNCAGFGTTAVPAGVPALPATRTRDSGTGQQDRSRPSVQLEVRVYGNVHRQREAHGRHQVHGDQPSEKLLPIESVFRSVSQLSLQGLPQLPVRHHPAVR